MEDLESYVKRLEHDVKEKEKVRIAYNSKRKTEFLGLKKKRSKDI
jgi:hypothetical protein